MLDRKRICPKCGERLPYAASGCHGCDWKRVPGAVEEAPARGLLLRRALVLAAAVLVVAAALYSQSRVLIAEKYASFAADYLPAALSSFAPAETEDGAFYFCIRYVAREIRDPESVETFPSMTNAKTFRVGDGVYRVVSYVDEERPDGTQLRRDFTCVARYSGGRWTLEDLALESTLEGVRMAER